MNLVSHPDVIHGCLNYRIWWAWAAQPRIHARSMKFRQKLEKINLSSYEIFFASRSQWNKSHSIWISILWDSIENMFFTIKIKISLMQFKELRKVCQNWFFAKSLSKSHFSKLLQVLLTFKNLFQSKIFFGKQNPWI